MASDRFQMINILLYAMIDNCLIFDELLNEVFFVLFFNQYCRWISPVCYPPTKSEVYIFASSVHPSVHSVRPPSFFVSPKPYLSTYLSD